TPWMNVLGADIAVRTQPRSDLIFVNWATVFIVGELVAFGRHQLLKLRRREQRCSVFDGKIEKDREQALAQARRVMFMRESACCPACPFGPIATSKIGDREQQVVVLPQATEEAFRHFWISVVEHCHIVEAPAQELAS